MTGASLLSPRRAGDMFAAGFAAFAARTLRAAAGTSMALLLGAAFLAGGAPAAGAGTLTFTFSDDGRDSTITASGSLDLSGFTFKESQDRTLNTADHLTTGMVDHLNADRKIWLISRTSKKPAIRFHYSPTVATVSVLSPFTGNTSFSAGSSYRSNFHFGISDHLGMNDHLGVEDIQNGLEVDKDYLSGTTLGLSGGKATFDGTLLETLGDSDFHIEIAFGSNRVIFKTRAPPATPAGLAATPGNAQVTLKWNDQSDDAAINKWQYRQRVNTSDSWGAWTDIPNSDRTTTTYTVATGLTNGTTYAFQIRAVGSGGDGAESNEATATPADAPTAAVLKAEAVAGRVTLSWTLAADASIQKWQYQKLRGTAANARAFADIAWTPVPGSGAATRSHTVRGLEGDVAYSFRVRAIGHGGDGAASDIATATPAPGPPMEEERQSLKHTLAAVAQATLDGAVDTIGQRLDVPSGRASLTLAGRQVGGMTALPAEKGNWWDRIDRWDGKSAAGSAGSQAVSPSALLGGSAFVLPLAAAADGKGRAAGAKLAVWGRGDYRSFAGRRRGERWDGRQWTGWLGVDGKLDRRLTAGVALSHGQGRADYRLDQFKGRVATSLTALWPYLQMKLARGGAVRLVLGAGRGRAEHRKFDGEAEKADLTMLAASASGRQPVARWGRIVLSTLAGASVAQIRTKGSPSTAIGGLRARSWRLRGGVEAEHDGLALSSRRNAPRLRPRLGLAVRQDGGDGVRGTGMELTGGMRLSRPGVRLVLDASGHWLALHGQSGTREWGASVAVRLVPRAGGRGLSLALGVERGSPRTGVLNREAAFASEAAEQPGRMLLSLRTGYGFALAGGVLTPFADMAFGTGDVRTRRYRTGVGFRRDGIEAALTAAHRRGSTAETRVDLDLRLSY